MKYVRIALTSLLIISMLVFNIHFAFYSEQKIIALVAIPFFICLCCSIVVRFKYYILLFSLITMYIWIVLFPKHYGTGLAALGVLDDCFRPFMIFISESVGFVLGRLIKRIYEGNAPLALAIISSPKCSYYIKSAYSNTKYALKPFRDKEKEHLLSCFTKYYLENSKDTVLCQIQNSFDFLDGAITRYELEDIPTSEHCNEESRELDFYCCYPKYLVKTDTNKEYSFTFCYHCLWTKHEDCTGIGSIRIEDKVSGESIAIGYFEYPYGDY